MPQFTKDKVMALLNERPEHLSQASFEHLLTGIFHPSINGYLAYRINDRFSLAQKLKQLDFHIDLNYVPDNNQVMNGGVDIAEVNSKTLESNLHPNLYIIGEALDVDGECGGFNLHFAWASATYAAQAIAKKQAL